MSAAIRELPSPRWIMFYDVELAFIPFDGKLWLSQSNIRAALEKPQTTMTPWDLEFPIQLEHINPREKSWFSKLELARHTVRHEPHFTIPSIRYFIETTHCRTGDHALYTRLHSLMALLDELEAQPLPAPLVHSHTCAELAVNLRSILDKHPDWERVLELWNLGKTEGNIASALNIKVTKVRSAVQHLEKYGFDVMRGERRDTFAASQGRSTQVPRVRVGDLV